MVGVGMEWLFWDDGEGKWGGRIMISYVIYLFICSLCDLLIFFFE